MISIQNEEISGKEVTKIIVTECNELADRVHRFLDDMNGIDAQAMNGGQRNLAQIENDLMMGIIGHIVVCEVFNLKCKPCKINFNVEGFHLTSNKRSIKVRTSLAQVPPCPEKHIEKFTITGYEDGDNMHDYYIQIIFCENPRINLPENCIDNIYIVGGVDKYSLNIKKDYPKKTMNVAMISTSKTIDQVITEL